uniref:Growth-regulating factor n=1 Tax=Aegilops tauschii subsp. strangulata TaxID=200361 RepID=A0A453CLA0_AEGTS
MTERRQEHSPPSKLPRLSGPDADADDNDGAGTVTMAAPSPLVLGLGLGVGGSCSDSGRGDAEASAATRPSALTFMQRQELEHQVLIYRYFAANAPVPVHLVLPIWKSVAASSSAPQRFPSRTCRALSSYYFLTGVPACLFWIDWLVIADVDRL